MGNPKSKRHPLVEKTKILMKGRGYEEDTDRKKSDENKDNYLYFKGNQGQQIIIHYTVKDETTGVAYIRDLVKKFDKKKIKRRIFIGSGKVTRSARNELIDKKVEFIPADLVLMDILEHEFVPKHEILSEIEVEKLLNQLKVPATALPGILKSDPVTRVIGAELGDVIKITRKSATAGETIIYRLVIKDKL